MKPFQYARPQLNKLDRIQEFIASKYGILGFNLMLTISKSQKESANLKRWHDTSNRIAKHLQENFDILLQHQGIDQPFLHSALLPTLQEAHGWGFLTERDLRVYAEGCAVLGWRFLTDRQYETLITAVWRAQSSEQRAKLVDQAMVLQESQVQACE